MIDDKDIGLIEGYLKERLTDAEKTAFEVRLRSDEEFREALHQHQWVLDGFDGMRLQKLEERVARLPSASDAGTVMSWKRIWPFALLALVALLLYFVVERLDNDIDRPKYQALADQYYDAPAALTTRSESSALSQSMRTAMLDYEDERWETAIINFRAVTEPAELPAARYYLAHTLYRSAQFEEAVQAFTHSREDREYAQQADWYLALALLNSGDLAAARDRFSVIAVDDTHFYVSRAIALLAEMPEG